MIRDLYKVGQNMVFLSEQSLEPAVELLSEMSKSISPQTENIEEHMHKDKFKKAICHLVFSLFYPDRARALEVFLSISNEFR